MGKLKRLQKFPIPNKKTNSPSLLTPISNKNFSLPPLQPFSKNLIAQVRYLTLKICFSSVTDDFGWF